MENKELEIAKTLCELTPTKEEKDLIVSALTRLEKYQKAIKIIKDKRVDICSILMSVSCVEYNERIRYYYPILADKKYLKKLLLTEEEWRFLKEVFGK